MKPALLILLAVIVGLTLFLLSSRKSSATNIVQRVSDKAAIFVFVKIPEAIMPIDRGEKFEDPLDSALKSAGLGEVTGGGSQLSTPDQDGSRHIEWVGIDVDLIDLDSGLKLLKSELKRLGAPPGTTIEYQLDGKTKTESL